MRLAVVGKGGTGKTTISVLNSLNFVKHKRNVILIDADINMNVFSLLKEPIASKNMHLSNPENIKKIKEFLKGNNKRIVANGAFRKSTPPTRDSNFFVPHIDNYISSNFLQKTKWENLSLMAVGTYDEEGIGTSCYHGNLSILENILSNTIDTKTDIIVDMVAGTDAFSNTLHAQFDMIILVLEPHIKSLEVFDQYKNLAKKAGIYKNIWTIGNKIEDISDEEFILNRSDTDKYLGSINISKHIKNVDKEIETLDINKFEVSNIEVLDNIFNKFQNQTPNFTERYNKIVDIHKKYIQKDFVTERYGDISNQIDSEFNILDIVEKYS